MYEPASARAAAAAQFDDGCADKVCCALERSPRLERSQHAYHSKWYLPAIRELVGCRVFREDLAWIAAQLVRASSADLTALTLRSASSATSELKERLSRFRRELLAWSEKQESANQIVQIKRVRSARHVFARLKISAGPFEAVVCATR